MTVLALDAVWLGILMADQIKAWVGPLMLETPRLGAALLFYVLYGAAVLTFVVRPAAALADGRARVARQGALLGLFCYMTYDLSNLATQKGWPVAFSVVDTGWGIVVTTVASLAGLAAWRRL